MPGGAMANCIPWFVEFFGLPIVHDGEPSRRFARGSTKIGLRPYFAVDLDRGGKPAVMNRSEPSSRPCAAAGLASTV